MLLTPSSQQTRHILNNDDDLSNAHRINKATSSMNALQIEYAATHLAALGCTPAQIEAHTRHLRAIAKAKANGKPKAAPGTKEQRFSLTDAQIIALLPLLARGSFRWHAEPSLNEPNAWLWCALAQLPNPIACDLADRSKVCTDILYQLDKLNLIERVRRKPPPTSVGRQRNVVSYVRATGRMHRIRLPGTPKPQPIKAAPSLTADQLEQLLALLAGKQWRWCVVADCNDMPQWVGHPIGAVFGRAFVPTRSGSQGCLVRTALEQMQATGRVNIYRSLGANGGGVQMARLVDHAPPPLRQRAVGVATFPRGRPTAPCPTLTSEPALPPL